MRQDDVSTFAALLQRYRRRAGLTQEALAERARLSVRGISDLERGIRKEPHTDTIDALATALQLGVEDRAAFERAARKPLDLPASTPTPESRHDPTPTPLLPVIEREQDVVTIRTRGQRANLRRLALLGIAVGSVIIIMVRVFVGTAQEKPGYPYYEYEGLYPTQTPCAGDYALPDVEGGATLTASHAGQTMTLTYYYHDACGSFARIENALPERCSAILDRSNNGGQTWDDVVEPVEPGSTVASTQIGNNLDGRRSRAALVCDNILLARTKWY